jgi:hypothetical protein
MVQHGYLDLTNAARTDDEGTSVGWGSSFGKMAIGAGLASPAVPPRSLRWRIDGGLTIKSVAGIHARLLGELWPGRQLTLALDLAHIEYFDAAGLQLLLSIERTLGSGFTVENPPPEVAGILSWTPVGAHCTSVGAAAERRPAGISLAARNPVRDGHASDNDWLIGVDSWHLSLRFDDSAFRADVEPLAAIRSLAALGALVHVDVVDDRVPALGQLDPTACCIGFELDLRTDFDAERVRSAIDALGKHAWAHAIAPAASVDEYVALIHVLPEGSLRVSSLLLASGVLTPGELKMGLRGRVRAPIEQDTQGAQSCEGRRSHGVCP